MAASAPVSCSLFAAGAPCEACAAGATEAGGCEAAAEYDAGYEDVAVRGMEETSRSVPSRDAGSSCGGGVGLLFTPLLEVGDAHRDGRYAVHDDHDDDGVLGVRLLDGAVAAVDADAALPTARACCSQTSRALWSTGQLSAVATPPPPPAAVSVFVPLGIGGWSAGNVEDSEVDAGAARAWESHTSLLLWSTGQAAAGSSFEAISR